MLVCLRIADRAVPGVPSDVVTCSRCGADCWRSVLGRGSTLIVICMVCAMLDDDFRQADPEPAPWVPRDLIDRWRRRRLS